MDVINEGSYATFLVEFGAADGDPALPTTIRYRVDCDTTAAAIVAWTSVSPATSVEITIPSTLNVMQSAANPYEIKTLTVEANEGLSTQFTQDVQWQLKNLDFIT